MQRRRVCRMFLAFIALFALPLTAAERVPYGSLPVTHTLSTQRVTTLPQSTRTVTETQTKYKDVSGRTVSTAVTQGNLTTHRDLQGKITGYTVRAGNQTITYDARGRAIR